MVVPDDHSGVRQYRLTSRALRTATTAVALSAIVLTTVAAGLVVRHDPGSDAAKLAHANELLVREVTDIRREMEMLESALMELSSRDERYRVLANLEPLDEDVKRAGIGGPGTRTLQTSRLWQVDRSLAELTFGTSDELTALTRRAQVLASSWNEATTSLEGQIDLWARTPSVAPVNGHKTSGFSPRRLHPILNVYRAHNGIDLAAPRGTPVVATARGTVSFAGNTGGAYGYMVDIDHGNGILSRYAHLARGSIRVREGQEVQRWDKIGEVGATGLVTAPSVHYEVLVDGRARNPDQFIIPDVLRF
jgi:murein DD-endopeptidase MepM/ murein hydrolase activator NlpD